MDGPVSKFEVFVESVADVYDHPNADRLSIVKIRGYNCISAKLEDGSHRYKRGDVIVYVPEDAIVPEYLLRQGFWDEKNNKGFLAGELGNRVKAVMLRGIISQGIIYPTLSEESNVGTIGYFVENDKPAPFMPGNDTMQVSVGDNVADFLGITKWEPEIPVELLGQVTGIATRYAVKYDFDSLQKHPNAFDEVVGDVVITEKLHGVMCEIGTIVDLVDEGLYKSDTYVTSKGLASKNLVMKYTEDNRKDNVYVRTCMDQTNLADRVRAKAYEMDAETLVVIGEIVGVQDLKYGLKAPTFFGFDIYVGLKGNDLTPGRFLNDDEKDRLFAELSIPRVPVLYRGPYDPKIVEDLATGKTTLNGGANILEGVVVTPTVEQSYVNGRLILKRVSEDYLVRKNGTEYQ